jgi:hypothetical protein
MNYVVKINQLLQDPRAIEGLYQDSLKLHDVDAFNQAIASIHHRNPDNLLIAAWYHRLSPAQHTSANPLFWPTILLLSLCSGFLYWYSSNPDFTLPNRMPFIFLIWAPTAGLMLQAYIFFHLQPLRRYLFTSAGFIILPLVIYLFAFYRHSTNADQYLGIALIHLPLLVWVITGYTLLGRTVTPLNRFA